MSTVIVLFSGGLDSTACLYWAKERYNHIILLSFLYGSREDEVIQRTNLKFSTLLSTDQKIIELPFLGEFAEKAESSLINSKEQLPVFDNFEHLDDVEITSKTAKRVWIPGRNVLFLSLAASFADSFKEPVDIIFGANLEEGSTFPDNTFEFVSRMNKVILLGCMNEIKIKAPFHDSDKKAIVEFLNDKKAEIKYSSSCYNVGDWSDKGHPVHCGKCESCQRRKRAFQYANIKDPTIYIEIK